ERGAGDGLVVDGDCGAHRSVAVVHRPWRQAADGDLGRDDARRLREHSRRTVAVDLAWHCNPAAGARPQHGWRWLTGRHRPTPAGRDVNCSGRFAAIIRADPDLMCLLERLQALDLPQWRLVAGCLYQTVWNVLTDRPRGAGIKDYDVIYFDGDDISWEA